MIRLIIILLIVYLFVRFYKHLSLSQPNSRNSGPGRFESRTGNDPADSNKRFEDIEEAEYVEINDDSKTKSKADHSEQNS